MKYSVNPFNANRLDCTAPVQKYFIKSDAVSDSIFAGGSFQL